MIDSSRFKWFRHRYPQTVCRVPIAAQQQIRRGTYYTLFYITKTQERDGMSSIIARTHLSGCSIYGLSAMRFRSSLRPLKRNDSNSCASC